MKFTADREVLLRPLQLVTGVVERRHTLPILANLLVEARDGLVRITGTDLEVSLSAAADGVNIEVEGSTTIPARKLTDIWRSLPDGANVTVEVEDNRAIVRSGRSRYALATLPPADFPHLEPASDDLETTLPRSAFARLLDRVSFSMAQQDVRYFLNGMLLELTPEHIRVVATDGHRLAVSTFSQGVETSGRAQAIIPRKGVLELGRVLAEPGDDVVVRLGSNHLRVDTGTYSMVSKLIDGKFPDYDKVVPRERGSSLVADRDTLKLACMRASILSNEKYRGVRLMLDAEQLTIQANNPEQEEALEVVPVTYDGEPMEIGFNVSYLQDVLGVLDTEQVKLSVVDANSSAVIEGLGPDQSLYVVMPMRL
jgi:DNA polymerase III subunit beta